MTFCWLQLVFNDKTNNSIHIDPPPSIGIVTNDSIWCLIIIIIFFFLK